MEVAAQALGPFQRKAQAVAVPDGLPGRRTDLR